MSPYLFPALQARYGKLNVLKKGNAYFSISTSLFVFKDAYLFTSPCSLSKYLKQNGIEETKSVFPYTLYKSIEEMKSDCSFPPHEAFFSELKNANISIKEYEAARSEFYRRKSLPETDPDYIRDMTCWLKYYNELDTVPLARAIDVSFRNFFDIFGIDPSFYTSLPKFAQDCMFKSYKTGDPLCYSFFKTQSDLRQTTRENLTGGLVNVFHRLIDLSGRKDLPKTSQIAPNGKPYSSLMFYDFNSLYLYAQLLPFPSTPGFFYIKPYFIFQCLIRYSLGAKRWLFHKENNGTRMFARGCSVVDMGPRK